MVTRRTWTDVGIDLALAKGSGPERKMPCPQCSPWRKKQEYPCLNVNVDTDMWHCWHCGWSGGLAHGDEQAAGRPTARPRAYRRPIYQVPPSPATALRTWFAERGIPADILMRRQISLGSVYMPQVEEEVMAIQFPYFRDGAVVNIKYRDRRKHFRMVGGAERVLYGLDDISGQSVVMTEGEIDALSVEVAGYSSVVSVPDGAPAPGSKDYASKFDYLASADALLAPMQRIILAVDTDGAGQALAEELARRLGVERCWRVRWTDGCKDANEVLMRDGVEALRACLDHATPWPVRGIVHVEDVREALETLYRDGLVGGVSPGWPSLAQHYTVREGELTVITGVPSHGKTRLLSHMLLHLAHEQGWRLSVFTPEHAPLERYVRLQLEQYLGLPFERIRTMDEPIRWEAEDFLNMHFSYLLPEDHTPTVSSLLALAHVQVRRQGIKGLVLDPWNWIEHSRPRGQMETEYVSEKLTELKLFALRHQVHVWVVVHPTKLQKAQRGEYQGKFPPPTLYDAAGSAHWYNKADCGLSVWRDVESATRVTEVHIQKIRHEEIGSPGMVPLVYDPVTKRYGEPSYEDAAWRAV